ncbi:MAG TPA: magnesium transporter, partial [Blastocatellia bacterium]|nr:magnesium transporter [Blastocatellia bacterium]
MMETRNKQGLHSAIAVPVVRKLLHRGARSRLARIFAKSYPVEVARLLSALRGSERTQAFEILLDESDVSHVAEVISEMSPGDSVSLLEDFKPDQIAKLLSEMPADDATSLASRLPEPLAAEVLALMETEPAADVRELLEHEERTAGRIMTRNYFALDEEVTIAEAVAALQKRSEEFEMVFYVYVVDTRDHLVGVVSLRKLLTTHPATQLKRIMAQDVISAKTGASQEEVARLVAEYNLLAIPVVDDEGKLVGIVTVDDVIDVLQDEVAEDLLALAGVTAEERVTTPASRSLRLRAPWLLVNLATTFAPAFVIARFTPEIEKYAYLAALVTIPMGMGGNAATQTLTVIIRALALHELPGVTRILGKQFIVDIGNGIINGLVAAVIGLLISGNAWIGLVLALAMVLNVVVSGLAGTLVPVALKKVGVDPAISSTVFVTTFTDVGGSLSFLGLATLFLKLWA